MYLLSNTTIWWIYIYIYIYYLLHREQLHVSALDNGHLQFVYEILINPLTTNDPYRVRTAPLTSKRCILYTGCTKIIQNIHGLFIWGREGVKWARDLVSVGKVGRCGLHERSMLLPSYV